MRKEGVIPLSWVLGDFGLAFALFLLTTVLRLLPRRKDTADVRVGASPTRKRKARSADEVVRLKP
jgi:hypothetical protein